MPESPTNLKVARILLIEDNPDDIEWTRKVFKRGHLANPLTVIEDGAKALDFLSRAANDPQGLPFDLILLDLTLPGLDGRELLRHFSEDRRLRNVPVVVLTGSQREEDLVHAYKTGAVAFLPKPIDVERLVRVVGDLYGYRIYIVKEN
jgi:CheY-like chemotaxis protein